jgi:hypothetical protein
MFSSTLLAFSAGSLLLLFSTRLFYYMTAQNYGRSALIKCLSPFLFGGKKLFFFFFYFWGLRRAGLA